MGDLFEPILPCYFWLVKAHKVSALFSLTQAHSVLLTADQTGRILVFVLQGTLIVSEVHHAPEDKWPV